MNSEAIEQLIDDAERLGSEPAIVEQAREELRQLKRLASRESNPPA